MNTTAPPAQDAAAPAQPDYMEDHAAWRAKVDARLDAGAQNMRSLREDLKANSEMTEKVREDTSELVSLLKSFQGAFAVFNMVGKLAKPLGYIIMACSAILAFWTAIKGGGSPK